MTHKLLPPLLLIRFYQVVDWGVGHHLLTVPCKLKTRKHTPNLTLINANRSLSHVDHIFFEKLLINSTFWTFHVCYFFLYEINVSVMTHRPSPHPLKLQPERGVAWRGSYIPWRAAHSPIFHVSRFELWRRRCMQMLVFFYYNGRLTSDRFVCL